MPAPKKRRQANRGPSEKAIRAIIDLLDNERPAEAIKRLDRLLQHNPRNARLHVLYGHALRQQENYDEAIERFHKAQNLGLQDSNTVRRALALCMQKKYRFSEVRALADEVLAKDPKDAQALSIKGDALYRLGEPVKARECYEQLRKLKPDDPASYQGLTHLVTFTPDSRVFEVLTRELDKDTLKAARRADMHNSLGKAYLDIGDDEKAFHHYQLANQVMDEDLPPINAEIERRLQFTRTTFTRPLFDALSPYGLQTRPQIIVSGMSRSGKSLVESLFHGVAGVELVGEDLALSQYQKEILEPWQGQQADWLVAQTPETTRAHARTFHDRMGASDAIKITTIPGNLWHLGLIGLWQPNVPIVFCLRDMLDLGITGYFQHYGVPQAYRYSYNQHHLGREIACAERVMEHWAQVLPNPVYLVEYEALVREPNVVMDNLLTQLGLERSQSWDDLVDGKSALLEDLGPVSSLNTTMPMTDRFVGFGRRFRDKLDPMIEGYKTIADQFPRRDTPAALTEPLPDTLYETDDAALPSETVEFDWQLPGRLMVMDNGGYLLRSGNCDPLMALEAFGLVTLDPAADISLTDEQRDHEQLQYVPQAVLGDGQPGTLYACMDAEYTSTLPPLPAEQQPQGLDQALRVLARLPVNTLKLDDIDGLDQLDWLLLDARHDNLAVLDNGERTLANALLLHVDTMFQPVYGEQTSFAELSHWAARHGFRFHHFVSFDHDQDMPARSDVRHQPAGSRLQKAAALFLPDAQRMATLNDDQRLKLAFVLDAVYRAYDVSYALLDQISPLLGNNYLKSKGFFDDHRNGPATDKLNAVHREIAIGDLFSSQTTLIGWSRQYPKDARVRCLQAEMAAGLAKTMPALGHINKALKLAPDDLTIRLAGVEILVKTGLWWEAGATLRPLSERYPEHPRVQRLQAEILAMHPNPDAQQIDAALHALADVAVEDDSAETARTLSTKAQLLAHQGHIDEALACHELARCSSGVTAGPIYGALAVAQADTLYQSGHADASCNALWQALDSHPYSPTTVAAYRKFVPRLAECQTPELASLATLHQELQDTWANYKQENLQYSFGDFGLPYQGFEPLKIPGSRPAMHRLAIYQLAQDLPQNARALDIGCNHGFLLLGLADQLSYGKGFDISQSCIDVGNIAARHMGLSHIDLTAEPFDDFVCKKPFDLVIACAVHHWIGVPLAEFGAKLYKYCKPGGIVLIESQGKRSTHVTESDFDDKVQTMASAGFEVIRTGSLCDDAINYREFQILRKVH